MRAILIEISFLGLALSMIAGIVFGLEDKEVFVPAPETTVRSFMQSLATRRYEQASNFLSDDLSQNTQTEDLKAYTHRLRQKVGDIQGIETEQKWIKGDAAEAEAQLKTEQGQTAKLRFHLSRDKGLWSIDRFDPTPVLSPS